MGKHARYKCPKCGRKLNFWSQEYIDKHLARCAKNHPPVYLHDRPGRPTKQERAKMEEKRKAIIALLDDLEKE